MFEGAAKKGKREKGGRSGERGAVYDSKVGEEREGWREGGREGWRIDGLGKEGEREGGMEN